MASGRAESSYFEPRQEVASKMGMVRRCYILHNQSDKQKISVRTYGEWKGGLVVKSTDCSPEGPEFKSLQPYDDSQPSVLRFDSPLWSV